MLGTKGRKGQWFLAGTLILLLMISTIALSKNQIAVSDDRTVKMTFDNINDDFARMVNSIASQNATSQNAELVLHEYSHVLADYAERRGAEISGYAMVAVPSDNGINITIVNMLGAEMGEINITACGASASIESIKSGKEETVSIMCMDEILEFEYLFETEPSSIIENEGSLNATKRVFGVLGITLSSGNERFNSVKLA